MKPSDSDDPTLCPIGESDCRWLDEVSLLKNQVDTLSELVSTDPLTELHNVRHFQKVLDAELSRTRRSGRETCVMMLDLDYFKNVNDTYGHEAGNIALKSTANVLCEQVRLSDVPCRYGGEEFVIILPETNLRQAIDVAERIRIAISEIIIEWNQDKFQFTASIGVNIFERHNPMTSQHFMDEVDKLLYQAKESGRNQVAHPEFSSLRRETDVSREERDALLK